jgi:hypothetical protein
MGKLGRKNNLTRVGSLKYLRMYYIIKELLLSPQLVDNSTCSNINFPLFPTRQKHPSGLILKCQIV